MTRTAATPRSRLSAAFGALAVACLAGCEGADADPGGAPADAIADPIPLPVLQVGPDVPLDVRVIPLDPERYLDQEVLCDLAFVGQLASLTGDEVRQLAFPAGQRVRVRCAAPTGLGWASLVLSPDAEGLAPYVAVGKRVRVRIRGVAPRDPRYPVLEFVAVVGDAPRPPRDDRGLAPVPAGFDFGSLAGSPERVGTRATCAILHVGPTEAIDPTLVPRYPTGATHHAVIACRSAREEAWVDLAFTPETALGSLRLERGVLLPVRVEARRGGHADLPVVSYVLR